MVHLDLRHGGVGAASTIKDPHADRSRSEVGRHSVDGEGKGAVCVVEVALSIGPAVIVIGASMTVGAGLWDGKGGALLLLGLLFVHGLEDFLAIVGYSLQEVSKSVKYFKASEGRLYSCTGTVIGRHSELIKWKLMQVLLIIEQCP